MLEDILLNGFRLNLAYTRELVRDVPDAQLAVCPDGFTNHPAFTLGHLVAATAMTVEVLGGDSDLPDGWEELFQRRGPGDPRLPEADATRYPAKAELLEVLEAKARAVEQLVRGVGPERLREPYAWRFAGHMPSVGDVLFFMCHVHHAWHIGQLAEWRRMMGYESALARMGRGP